MRVIVKPAEFRFPIPILLPSVLVFNHITAIIGLLVLLILRAAGKCASLPLSPWKCFVLFHRLILRYWITRIRNPGWKLVEVDSRDAKVSIKL